MSANAPVPNASSPDGTLSGTWQVEQTVLREVDVAGNVTIGNVTYLRAYQQRRLRVLEKERPQVGNYPASVATAWSINFEAVQASSSAAADVLGLGVFLAPDNIPGEILRLGNDHLGKTLSAALA